MKQSTDPFHREVLDVISKHWPMLVARELIKLGGVRTKKLEPEPEPVVPVPVVVTPPPPLPPLQMLDNNDPQTFMNAVTKYGSRVKAAKALGMAETTFRDRWNRARARVLAQLAA